VLLSTFVLRRPPRVPARLGTLLAVVALAAGVLVTGPAADAASVVPVTPGAGFAVSLSADNPAQSFSFRGTAGRRVTLTLDSPPVGGAVFTLVSPAGVSLQPQYVQSYGELGVLTSSGRWTILGQFVGSDATATATLGLVTDIAGSLTLRAPVTVRFTKVSQNAALSFSAKAGQKLALSVAPANLTSAGGEPAVEASLVRPDGTSGAYITNLAVPGLTTVPLDVSGTWTLRLDPLGDTTGRVSFTADKPVDKVVAVTSGVPVTVTYPGGGRDIRLTIPGAIGQRLTLAVQASSLTSAQGTFPSSAVQATILRPDGTDGGYLGDLSEPRFSEREAPLDLAGTWTVLLHPLGDTIGTQKVRVGVVSDTIGTITVGTATTFGTKLPGQNARYTFAGEAGQALVASLDTSNLISGTSFGTQAGRGFAALTVFGPDGSYLAPLVNQPESFGEVTLPAAGTYTVRYDPAGDATGTATFLLRKARTATTAITLGAPSTVQITPGDTARLTFPALAGRRLAVSLPQLAFYGVLTVRRPDGSAFDDARLSSSPQFSPFKALDTSGIWSVEIDPDRESAGPVEVSVRQPADTVSALAFGSQVTATISGPGDLAVYEFQGTAGRRLAVETTAQSWTPTTPIIGDALGSLTLVAPNGVRYPFKDDQQYNFPAISPIRAFPGIPGIGTSGPFKLEVGGLEGVVGSRTFRLIELPETSQPLTFGTPETADLTVRGTRASYPFTWDGSGSLRIAVSTRTVAGGQITLTTPSGGRMNNDFSIGSPAEFTVPGFNEPGAWTLSVTADDPATGTVNFTAQPG
jgi:hypothetical protein